MWKASGTFEDRRIHNREEGGSNTLKGINAKVLDCNSKSILVSPPNSCWRRSNSTSRRQSSTMGRLRPGMRSGDVPPLHHLHGDDERAGGHRQAAQAHKLKTFTTTKHVSGQDTGFSSAQDQERPGVTTSGKPKNRRQVGQKSFEYSTNMQENLDTQSFLAPGNPQTETVKRTCPLPRGHGDCQHDL